MADIDFDAIKRDLAKTIPQTAPAGAAVNPNLRPPIATPERGAAGRPTAPDTQSGVPDIWDRLKASVRQDPRRTDTLTGEEREGPGRKAIASGEDIWDNLKSFASKSVEDLRRGAREVGRAGGEAAQGLMPTEAGARAGGAFVGRLGDIATFAAGGLTGPLSLPQQAAGLARGMEVQPRVAQVPRPQLALPAPTMGTAGSPALQTGPGRPAPPQQLIPQRMGDPIKFTPTPGTGMIPPGPGATMTTPEATPAIGPRTPPVELLVPPGAKLGEPSKFASAILANTPEPIDRNLTRAFRRTMKPGVDPAGLTHQDRQIMTAVDSIIDASQKENVRFTSPEGRPLKEGKLPETLGEFVQGINQLKTQVFQEYDAAARAQGGQGVRVSLQPTIAKLAEIAAENPVLRPLAERQASEWAKEGSYSPLEMQNVIKSLYSSTREIGANTSLKNDMLAQVLPTLTNTLNNEMMTALQGPQYQILRNRYGALTSIEHDVGNALQKDLAKKPGGAGISLPDYGAIVSALAGIAWHEPRSFLVSGGLAGAKYLRRYLNEPNRAVRVMFEKRAADLQYSLTERGSAYLGSQLGEMRQRQYDRTFYPYRDPHVSVSGP